MKTIIFKIDPEKPDCDIISWAAGVIRRGELVGFPTETVYGLAADAFNEDAVRRVFEVKGRPPNNPLPVQVSRMTDVDRLAAAIPDVAACLMRDFFPGPLTIVFVASSDVSEIITAGSGKVGIRMPNHPVALSLLKAAEGPIVAPSANTSGDPPPTTAEEVVKYFDGKIELVLDAGPTTIKTASTVIDVTGEEIRVLREGVVTREMLSDYGTIWG